MTILKEFSLVEEKAIKILPLVKPAVLILYELEGIPKDLLKYFRP